MGCGCGGGGNASSNKTSNATPVLKLQTKKEDCTITKEAIQKWMTIIKCVSAKDKLKELGLSEFNINQTLGIMQSALNYPDNYCMYEIHLDAFQNDVLIKIVASVPECLNQ